MASEPGLDHLDADFAARYRSYLECLNRRAWPDLGLHVRDDVVYNDEVIGLSGYRSMLQRDTSEIPPSNGNCGTRERCPVQVDRSPSKADRRTPSINSLADLHGIRPGADPEGVEY